MPITLFSWNVEHFRGRSAERFATVVNAIRTANPDVFALLEVEELDIKTLIEEEFPNYSFGLTDGPQVQEILVGWRSDAGFRSATFTAKRQFKVYNPSLRPGALLEFRDGDDRRWHFLFLHTDSGIEARDFGHRYEMFDKIWKLNAALGRAFGPDERVVVGGDLNTMGMRWPRNRVSDELATDEQEIEALDEMARRNGMRLLPKDFDQTWSDRRGRTSNLDHILVTDPVVAAGPVEVAGWRGLAGDARVAFVDSISDHNHLRVDLD